jgi:hypothetical protein
MSNSYWRDRANPIIVGIVKEHNNTDSKELRKALYEAYPFGERKYHPYKIWLDEIQKVLQAVGAAPKKAKAAQEPDKNQMVMMI